MAFAGCSWHGEGMTSALLSPQAPQLSDILSFSGQRWRIREAEERLTAHLRQQHNLPEAVARVLAGRGIAAEDAETFLNPTLKALLPDPSHLKDMNVAAERLSAAVMSNECVAVFGDYDVDGATSSAVLLRFFKALGTRCLSHIPDRMREGYGPNLPALLSLKAQGAAVVVTVDCGTVAFEPLEAATDAGLDIIVVDHHISEARLPKVLAVVNPNRLDETSTCRTLAAVGVTFLLCVAVVRQLRATGWFANHPEPNLLSLLDLVALGTVCDVMPLTGLNRAFVAQGLKVLATRSNAGLAALADVAGVADTPNAYTLGFLLGPRINAGGRVGKSELGTRLLSSEEAMEIPSIARELDVFNAERKAIETLVLEQAIAAAEAIDANAPVLVVRGDGWHQGVIGIVAGRLKERYRKPVAVVSFENGIGKASARSITGVDFGSAVASAKAQGLLMAGGGHAMAAGFTVSDAQFEAFATSLHTHFAAPVAAAMENRSMPLDGVLSLGGVTTEMVHSLSALAPFGTGNPEPRFALMECRLLRADWLKDTHLRLVLGDGGIGGRANASRLKTMLFRASETPWASALLEHARNGRPFHLAGHLRLNRWNGQENVDFTVEDAMPA